MGRTVGDVWKKASCLIANSLKLAGCSWWCASRKSCLSFCSGGAGSDAMLHPVGWAPALPSHLHSQLATGLPCSPSGHHFCIPSLPVCPSSLFVANHSAEDAGGRCCEVFHLLSNTAFKRIVCLLSAYENAAQVCCQVLQAGQVQTQSRSLLVGQVQAVWGASSGGPLGRRGGCSDSWGAALCHCCHTAVHRCSEEPLKELVASGM